MKLRTPFTVAPKKKNEILRNQFDKRSAELLPWKSSKQYCKKLRGKKNKIKEDLNKSKKKSHVHKLKDLILLRWQYSLNWSVDSVQSLSESQLTSL